MALLGTIPTIAFNVRDTLPLLTYQAIAYKFTDTNGVHGKTSTSEMVKQK